MILNYDKSQKNWWEIFSYRMLDAWSRNSSGQSDHTKITWITSSLNDVGVKYCDYSCPQDKPISNETRPGQKPGQKVVFSNLRLEDKVSGFYRNGYTNV